MPRGKSSSAHLDGATANAAPGRVRRALGDVSNRESKQDAKDKGGDENKTLRRSRRLATGTVSESNAAISKRSRDKQRVEKAARKRSKLTVEVVQSGPKTQRAVSDAEQRNDVQPSRVESRPEDLEHSYQERRFSALTALTRPGNDQTFPTEDYGLQRRCRHSNDYTFGISEYDIANKENSQEVSKYAADLFQRLFNEEHVSTPHLYMDRNQQPELNSMMRSILVDWIIEVHMKFRLLPDTLYLCINIIDRYLSRKKVSRNRLQLVGVTSLLLACKYEEIYPPEVRDCVYITDRAYTRQDVLDMEADIVKTLQFRLTVPTGFPFLTRFLHVSEASSLVKHLSSYYMERMLQEHSALEYKPSLLAATAVSLALFNPDRIAVDTADDIQPSPMSRLLRYTGFNFADIFQAAALFEAKVGQQGATQGRRDLVAVRRKYESARYESVSNAFVLPRRSHLSNPNSTTN